MELRKDTMVKIDPSKTPSKHNSQLIGGLQSPMARNSSNFPPQQKVMNKNQSTFAQQQAQPLMPQKTSESLKPQATLTQPSGLEINEIKQIMAEQDKIAITLKKIMSEKNDINSDGMKLAIDMFMRQQDMMHKRISAMNGTDRGKLENEKEEAKRKSRLDANKEEEKKQESQKKEALLF
jgi:hypothetical protein